jgi:hypothetical protein
MNSEIQRLTEAREGTAAWKKWGPYLSERQWGTVREDYSQGSGRLQDVQVVQAASFRLLLGVESLPTDPASSSVWAII